MRVVNDEVVTPTSTAELARQILRLSLVDFYGVYHATAKGCCSWYDFAPEIIALTNTSIRLAVAKPGEFTVETPRPTFSVLDIRALTLLGLNTFRPWQGAIQESLDRRAVSPSPGTRPGTITTQQQ